MVTAYQIGFVKRLYNWKNNRYQCEKLRNTAKAEGEIQVMLTSPAEIPALAIALFEPEYGQ